MYARRRAAARYENFSAAPEKKYGDSISKMQNQYAPLLYSLHIDASEENQRAAEVLTRNDMDITEKNIRRVRSVTEFFMKMADALHPCIVISIFERKHNPFDMRVGDILRYIDKFDETYGGGHMEKVAELIAALDKKGEMDQTLRAKVIEFYQALNQIQKNGGAAFGAILKHKKKITPGNLWAAARSYQYKPSTSERTMIHANWHKYPRSLHVSHTQKHRQENSLHHARFVHRHPDQHGAG